MTLEIWIAFALASAALLAIPGPTVMLVVSYALGRGRQSGWATVPGVTLGDFTAMTISLAGAGAILAASATLFTVLKLVGAAYLIWLGIGLLRAKPALPAAEKQRAGLKAMFLNSYVVTALNPKGIVFFIAFVPQFIDPAQPVLLQLIVLEATFLGLAALNTLIWVLLAGEMRTRSSDARTLKWVNRVGGSLMISAGILSAFARRA
ncbi:MAG: LysE family translocator [Pseudomonadota bacterium]